LFLTTRKHSHAQRTVHDYRFHSGDFIMFKLSGKWLVIVAVIACITGALGGGVAGGVAGYLAARQAQPAPVTAAPVVQAPQPANLPGNTTQVIDEESGVISAVQRVEPAVVFILNESRAGTSSGSGVIISDNGYIVTNNHVVEGAARLSVTFYDGQTVDANLIGTYPASDLAILQVNAHVPAVAELGDSDSLQLGRRVIAIGSALGRFQNTVTTGIVSGLGREVGGINGLIQTDASINHGNSGGPLINLAGQVVGINSMVVRSGGGDVAEGLGFSIPSNVVRPVSEQLIANGVVQRAYFGVTYRGLQTDEADQLNMPVGSAAVIQSVAPGGPADRAGLQAGDIIVAVNDRALNSSSSLPTLTLSLRPGADVTLNVVRNGQTGSLSLTLGAFPA
jgi:2-alkenal reductase